MPTRQIDRDRLEVTRFRVRVVSGVDAPRAIDSGVAEVTIGSSDGQTLCLHDPAVSRHHCVIRVTEDGMMCEDLGSTNGTFVGGRRVASASLAHGDTIGVGESVLAIELLDDTEIEELSPRDHFGRVLGHSVAMRRVFALLQRVARSDASILIEGETGTGKSALAEAIHDHSPRAGGPFVVIDCGALPPSLLESELFGHERGAFTGAIENRIGLFESASGGTILLDEIGELPLDLQPKLLRALERRVIRRVGASREVPVDIRVIAATHRDLRRQVNRKLFRSDLWYRLNTVRVVLPPLRERREDLGILVTAFYREMVGDAAAIPPGDLMRALARASWRGNVRELRSAVERALVGAPVVQADPAPEVDLSVSFRDAKTRATTDWERRYLNELLPAHDGNVSRAARAAQMNRGHLTELIQRHRIATAPLELDGDGEE